MTEENNQSSGPYGLKKQRTLTDFNNSFSFDQKLFHADFRVNLAYCEALFEAGILTRLESERIKNGLQTIVKRADFDKNYFNEHPSADIHSFTEARLIQLIGEAARKLQTGKSRIEQTATVFRLWLREEIEKLHEAATDLQTALVETAEQYREGILPAFIHLKKARPILWAHWCLAYFEMFARDLERLDEVWRRVNVMPLGSGDAAGTSFEIDREEIAAALGFEGVSANSLDAVSDRDFAVEFIGAGVLLMIHLSRLAEDLILYSSAEFGFISLNGADSSDRPDVNQQALELIRGKTGRIIGHQVALATTLKGLPTAFSQDLQEDKEAVFDTLGTVRASLAAASEVLRQLHLNEVKTRAASLECFMAAEELTDYLIQRGVSFGTARQKVAKINDFAASNKKKLRDLSLDELRTFSADFEHDVIGVLRLEQILSGKNQIGGTAPEKVLEALRTAREELER